MKWIEKICPYCETSYGTYSDEDKYGEHECTDIRIEILEARLAELESRFTAPEPQPACKLAHDWMLQHLKDIASELENESDLKLWDAVQDLDES